MSAEKRAKPESLDFFLAAIAPVFIIGMIGSLVFFMITVFYQGSHTERLMWILGLYTLATVLIARIAIEQSRQIAFAYMFALAAATLVVTPQLFVVSGPMAVFSFPILILLLVTVAFLADRITFDCTSMNEQQQSSGVGLLQSLGLVKSERKLASEQKTETNEIDSIPSEIKKRHPLKRKHNPGVWVLYFALFALPLFGLGQLAIKSPVDRRWAFACLFFYLLSSLFLLVLISLLSLRKYLRERGVPMETSFAIRWMAIGMTSVAVILLALSLLPIPGQSMLSMDLPFRIASRDDLKANPWGWGREGVEGEGPEQGKGEPQNKRGGEQDGKGPDDGGDQGDKQKDGKQHGDNSKGDNSKGDNSKGDNSKGDNSKGDNSKGDKAKSAPKDGSATHEPGEQSNDKERDASEPQSGKDKLETREKEDANSKKNSDPKPTPKPREPKQDKPASAEQPPRNNEEKDDGPQNAKQPPPQQQPQDRPKQPNQAEQPPPQPPQPRLSIQYDFAAVVQWLMMILLAIVAIVFGIVYRRELLAAVNSFLDWIRMLLGGKKKSPPPKVHVVEEATLLEDLYPPFHSFANPFRKGSGLSHEQMVRHMYRAMLSWGYEHRVVRREDETPEEFMRRLFRRFPEQQESFSALGMLYNRIAYARGKVTAAEMQPLVEFWKWLEQKTATEVA